eukprot:UN02980
MMKKQIALTEANDIVVESTEDEPQAKLQDIEPSFAQYICILAEAVFESMPQVVLQTVFLVQTHNNEDLPNSNINILIFTSLIASILSVANKFYLMDKNAVIDKAKSLNPEKKFGECCNVWYLIRIFWRVCHILSRFAIFSLIWICVGGMYLLIFIGCSFVWYCIPFCLCVCCISWCHDMFGQQLYAGGIDCATFLGLEQFHLTFLLGIVSLLINNKPFRLFTPRFIENCVALTVVTIFANFEWD